MYLCVGGVDGSRKGESMKPVTKALVLAVGVPLKATKAYVKCKGANAPGE